MYMYLYIIMYYNTCACTTVTYHEYLIVGAVKMAWMG